jgi:hypothetical protein
MKNCNCKKVKTITKLIKAGNAVAPTVINFHENATKIYIIANQLLDNQIGE